MHVAKKGICNEYILFVLVQETAAIERVSAPGMICKFIK